MAEPLDVARVIAKKLREIRFDRGETQLAIGKRAKIHRAVIGRIERGTHMVTLPVLARVCRALRVDPYEVVRVLDAHVIDPRNGRCRLRRRRPSAWRPQQLPFWRPR